MCLLGKFRLFSIISLSHSLKNVIFWSIFLTFWVYFSYIFSLPRIRLENWNLISEFSIDLRSAFWLCRRRIFSLIAPPSTQSLFRKKQFYENQTEKALLFIIIIFISSERLRYLNAPLDHIWSKMVSLPEFNLLKLELFNLFNHWRSLVVWSRRSGFHVLSMTN